MLRGSILDCLRRSGVEIVPALEVDNFAMAMAMPLVMSTALLPISINGYLPPSIVGRPLASAQPTVDLVLGYRQADPSPPLQAFLSGSDDLADRIYNSVRAGR